MKTYRIVVASSWNRKQYDVKAKDCAEAERVARGRFAREFDDEIGVAVSTSCITPKQFRQVRHPSFPHGLDGRPIFLEISGWCDHCGFYFERKDVAAPILNPDGSAHSHREPWRLVTRSAAVILTGQWIER